MTLKPLFLHYSPDDSLSSYFLRPRLVDCCLALYPFRTDALFLMLQVQKGVAALPPCQLGNMRSVDGHSSDCSRWLILTRPSRVTIRSQFAPSAISLFLLYLRQSIECSISLIQTGIDTNCIPSYIRSTLPSMITHCHHFSHLALRIHC